MEISVKDKKIHGNAKYFNEEEKKGQYLSIRKYLSTKEWICLSDKKYLLKNKWNHCQTKMHKNNLNNIE